MSTNTITSDFQLDQLCKEYAQDIISDAKYGGGDWLTDLQENYIDRVDQWADGSEHVIYYYRALQICANCNTDQGQQFVEDTGTTYSDINKLASAIAYGEIYSRVMFHLEREIEFLSDLALTEEA